ncbi:MAG: AraC family transcriptional regulator [Reichenbachiella sp.]|uniref:helix-turn-helix domain-containing protein n=1 Tax=Reichenbachiella sp. TaxID=2184521 RepID=UPI003263F039
MDSFSALDILLFLGITQGLFLAGTILLTQNKNKEANRALAIALILASIMLFGRVVASRITEEWVWRVGTFADTSVLLFAPLLYLYVRRLTYSEKPVFRLSIYHYLPAIIHVLYFTWTLSKNTEEIYELYRSGTLPYIFMTVETIGLISFYFYWIKSVLLLRTFEKLEAYHLSYKQNVKRYLIIVLSTLLVLILFWSFSFTGYYILEKPFDHINYDTMWICTPVFIYLIGYFSIIQPEVFRMPLLAKKLSERDRLSKEEIKHLQERLNYYINEEELFLQKNLTLKSLSDAIGTSSNNLSWLLNQVYNTSFYDYINQKRIEEFQKKIKADKHLSHTLFGLAIEVGFSSKSTFNKAFKTVTNQTPKDYIRNLDKKV